MRRGEVTLCPLFFQILWVAHEKVKSYSYSGPCFLGFPHPLLFLRSTLPHVSSFLSPEGRDLMEASFRLECPKASYTVQCHLLQEEASLVMGEKSTADTGVQQNVIRSHLLLSLFKKFQTTAFVFTLGPWLGLSDVLVHPSCVRNVFHLVG